MASYPKNWKEIRNRVRARADNKCDICGAPGGAFVIRFLDDKKQMTNQWRMWEGRYPADGNNWSKPIKIILHTHHIGLDFPDGSKGDPHDKSDCRPENLACLCQKHHLEADKDIHVAVRRRKSANRHNEELETLGQQRMFR